MRPGERIRLVTESAQALSDRSLAEIQLTLRTYGLRAYEPGDMKRDVYCLEQIEDAGDDQLVGLHTYLLGQSAAPGLQQASARPWGSNPVALFISHRHEDAGYAGKLREILGSRFGIDAFVAHADIEPSRNWRETIRLALSSCHFMVAILHDEFHTSQWCDQEVGWALGRGIPLMPVRRSVHTGPRFDGFLEEHQELVVATSQQGSEWWLAEQIFTAVLADARTRAVGIKALSEALVNSYSYDQSRKLWAMISEVDRLDSEQLRRLEYAVETNAQVYGCVVDGETLPAFIAELVHEHEPVFDPPF